MRCSLLRPKLRSTGRVWVKHRRTLLDWLHRTGFLDEYELRSEVYRLVAVINGSANSETVDRLMALPGQEGTAAALVKRIAAKLLDLDREIKDLDKTIADYFCDHPYAQIIESLPGF